MIRSVRRRWYRFLHPIEDIVSVTTSLAESRRVKKGIPESRLGEVRKIFYAKFAPSLPRADLDPEEVLAEVYLGIVVRNKGACPYDPNGGSSFGHYVYMVTNCVVRNCVRKVRRRNDHEVHIPDGEDGEDFIQTQGKECADRSLRNTRHDLSVALGARFSPEVASKVLSLLGGGMNITEISREIGIPTSRISRAVREVREAGLQ